MTITKPYFIVIGPVLALTLYALLSLGGMASQPAATIAITFLTVFWWITEAIPIPATSLIPFALLPLCGVINHKAAAASLGNHVVLLLLGAFMLSKSLERSNVHQRLAVFMVRLVGVSSGQRLVFGFMLSSALLSMWISNTATTLIMLPAVLAILSQVDNQRLKVALILGVAYASSIGGIGTPIGTPPNAIFMGIYEEYTHTEFSFLEWMKIGTPIVFLTLPVMALWLTRNVKLTSDISLPPLGKWRAEEKRTLAIFAFTVVAWITRNEPFGGWTDLFHMTIAGDSTVALTSVVIMFLVPNGKGGNILDWDTVKDIPWDMLLLFASGIALTKGFAQSGLSTMLGNWLASLAHLPLIALIFIICLLVTYLTEVTSNTATTTLLMPILAAAGASTGHDPALFMVPAAMAASSAFMLPVATAPNAIAYGTGEIEIKDMVIEGAILSLGASCIIGLMCYLLLPK